MPAALPMRPRRLRHAFDGIGIDGRVDLAGHAQRVGQVCRAHEENVNSVDLGDRVASASALGPSIWIMSVVSSMGWRRPRG